MVYYAIVTTPLGHLLLAGTAKGICVVRLGDNKETLERELKREFKSEVLIKKDKYIKPWMRALEDYLSGRKPWPLLPYEVQATPFQRRVWDTLRSIPSGTTYSYSQAAKAMGHPKAIRALARACAANPVALVIPCHRIVPLSGGTGGYRWGIVRKKTLLELEKN